MGAPHCQKGRPRAEGSCLRVPQLLPQRQLLALLQVRSHSGRTFSQERMQTTRCGSPDQEYSRPRNIWWDSQPTALWPRQPLDRWQNNALAATEQCRALPFCHDNGFFIKGTSGVFNVNGASGRFPLRGSNTFFVVARTDGTVIGCSVAAVA